MDRPLLITKPISGFEISAARISISAGLLFALLLGSLHLLEPEFDPTWRVISEYALGRFGWLMRLAFAALAVSLASVGLAVMSQSRTVPGYIGLGILALGVAGLLIAATFKTDPITTSPEAMTFSGKMHILGASLDYSPVAFLLLSFSLARNPAWKPVRNRLFITAGITLVVTVIFVLTLPRDGVIRPGVLTGLVGRFLLLSYLGWILSAAVHVLKLRNQEKSSGGKHQ